MARWSARSAALGAALLLCTPLLPVGAPPSFGSIEHTFLFLPLVAAPLALLLLATLLGPEGHGTPLERAAQRLQPFAAAMLVASFSLPVGPLSAALATPWLVMAALVALGAPRAARVRPGGSLAGVSLVAAHVFLVVGSVWLLLSRLGVAPRGLTDQRVLLAALHFHYSGFMLQLLLAATGLRLLSSSRPGLVGLHRASAAFAVAGIPLIAAGNLAGASALRFAGVALMVLASLALAVTSTAAALDARSREARFLLIASAASLAAAMTLAGIYGLAELRGHDLIGIPRMAVIHGLLNALGFTLSGLAGHLLESARPREE